MYLLANLIKFYTYQDRPSYRITSPYPTVVTVAIAYQSEMIMGMPSVARRVRHEILGLMLYLLIVPM